MVEVDTVTIIRVKLFYFKLFRYNMTFTLITAHRHNALPTVRHMKYSVIQLLIYIFHF